VAEIWGKRRGEESIEEIPEALQQNRVTSQKLNNLQIKVPARFSY
jgi:hypothetical protein